MAESWRTHPDTASEVLVDDWLTRIESARKSADYQAWKIVADQCVAFYQNSAKFMWDRDFSKKYIGDDIDIPRFQITINKPWEYIQIIGPYLFWDYPHRRVKPHEPLRVRPEWFAGDPWAEERYAEQAQRQEMQYASASARAELMQKWQNYTPREQPDGLHHHGMLAVLDAMLTGRGVLVPRVWSHPGDGRKLTGLFHESSYDLFVDPDCRDPLLRSAKWIAIRHQSAVWELEDRFGLKRGTLEDAGNLASYESVTFNGRSVDGMHRAEGATNDIIVWYEVWSRGGVGGRRRSDESPLIRQLDEVVGDFAYLCIAPSVPWLLNAPPAVFENPDLTEEDVREMLGWPHPYGQDSRWPVAILDFNPKLRSPWPLAPLGAALGEMICMNVLTAAFVEHAYENRKSVVVILDEAAKDIEAVLRGNKSPAVVRIKAELQKTIDQVVSFIERPGMNTDILAALEYVGKLFEQRTGLNEFMYGSQTTQSRSARDIAAKEEKTAIRPEKMSRDVAAWMTEGATLEMFIAATEITGQDTEPRVPGELWDELIASQDLEEVLREMSCYVEATDVRRPNRERTLESLGVLSQQYMPVFQAYAEATSDSQPINALIQRTGEAMELPMREMELGPWRPEIPPEVMEQQQMEQQAEQMKAEAEMAGKQMDMEAKQADAENKRQLAEIKAAAEAQKLQLDAVRGAMELEQDQRQHALEMFQQRQLFGLQRQQREAEGEQKIRLMRQQARAKPTKGKV